MSTFLAVTRGEVWFRRLPSWAPLDVRVILWLAAFLMAWKLVSVDYSALADLVGRQPFHPLSFAWLRGFTAWLHQTTAADATVLRGLQIGGAVATLLGTWRLSRAWIIVGMLLTAAVYLPSQPFSAWMYDIELCWMLLFLAVIYPARWSSIFGPSRMVASEATGLGLVWLVYFAAAYFFCGWSKLMISPRWFLDVRLDLLFPVMKVWHQSAFNLGGIAEWFHHVLQAAPWIGTLMALTTLLAELFWPLAVASSWARRWIPLVMFGTHVAIFLTSGILFLHLAVLQLACVIRWRDLDLQGWRRGVMSILAAWRTSATSEPAPVLARPQWAIVALSLVVVTVPATTHWQLGMLADWNQFGWSYHPFAQPMTCFRLGYVDPDSGQIKSVPMNHAGFMDFRGVIGPMPHLSILANYDNELFVAQALEALEGYRRVIRDGHSNAWLLGPLTCPAHLHSPSPSLSRETLRELVVLGGETYVDDLRGEIVDRLQPLGPLPVADSGTIPRERLAAFRAAVGDALR